ncbi:MAG: MFS transporter [Elusimicrobiota bacterium]
MELNSREKTLASAGVILGVFLAAIESTVVATAMPTATSALGGISLIHYVFAVYSLATVTTITMWGKLADMIGLRRTFWAGCLIFLAASALCGISQNIYQLIAFRFFQGIGAGAIFPVAMTTLSAIHSQAKRVKMQIYLSAVWAVASVIGPPIGAVLTQQFSWRWVFYLNIPFGALSLFLVQTGLRQYGDGQSAERRPFDAKGSALNALWIVLLLTGIAVNKKGRFLFGPAAATAFVSASALAAFIFFRHLSSAKYPFISPSMLRHPIFIKAGAGNLLICTAMFGAMAYVPLFSQAGLGETVIASGHTLTLCLLGWIITSAVATRIYLRISARTLARFGMGAMTLAFAVLALGHEGVTVNRLRACLFVVGAGMGLCFAPLLLEVQNAVPRRDLGSGTATLQLLRNLGGLMGVSLMGTILAMNWDRSGPTGAGLVSQFQAHEAMGKVFMAGSIFALAGLLSVWNLPVPKNKSLSGQ